jgi:hypothetical protein
VFEKEDGVEAAASPPFLPHLPFQTLVIPDGAKRNEESPTTF